MSLLKLALPQFDISVHRICDLEKSFSAGGAHNMIDCQSNDRRVPFSYFSKKAHIHSAFSENVTQFHILKCLIFVNLFPINVYVSSVSRMQELLQRCAHTINERLKYITHLNIVCFEIVRKYPSCLFIIIQQIVPSK